MSRRGVLAAASALGLASIGCGGGGAERTGAPSGRELYARHCASCHGVDGKGEGPVAASLRVPPPDLTILAREDRFDEGELMAIIDGRRTFPAHGTRAMPVWGAVFSAEEPAYAEYTTLLHVRALVDHVRTIQEGS